MPEFPTTRMRRLRDNPGLRGMVRETSLSASDFIYPMFVVHGRDTRVEVPPMPGIYQMSLDHLVLDVEELYELGIRSVMLFGIPAYKDEWGSDAYSPTGVIQGAIEVIKQTIPEMTVIGDVCLCEFTSHGHCGVINGDKVDNDATLELLARMAVRQAEAGVDMVAPSAMMDGQVAAIRAGLDDADFGNVPIMAYSAKYASGFYGPFRVAADSTPQFGDRAGYQMDTPNVREAMREIALDIEEGADMVMVKPALAYLDVLRTAREKFATPIAAYNVSGEYSMVKAAAENEWIDGRRITMEILTGIKRAGADVILSYHAKEVAEWLQSEWR